MTSVRGAPVPGPGAGATIDAFGFPTTSGPGVPVFLWVTDLSGAVRVTYADRSMSGYTMPEGTTLVCFDESMHPVNNGCSDAQATPYGATVLFDATSGRSASIHDRRDCERGARAFVAGPGRFGPE